MQVRGSDDGLLVRLDAVSRNFDELVALDGVSFELAAGEVVGLLGHNGAGKTTCVRLMTGLLASHGGSVRVHGRDPLTDGGLIRRATGVVSAVPSVDDRLTARQNLDFVGAVFGVEPAEVGPRSDELLSRLGLAERADERVGAFSSGMRQRLAIARALLPDPPLLLLDEPTAALDPVASRDVRTLLASLADDGGRGVLLCSHNLVEVQQLCDRVVILEHGRVIADGTPAGLAAQLGIARVSFTVDVDDHPEAHDLLRSRAGDVESAGPGQLLVTGLPPAEVPALVTDLVSAGVRLHAIVPVDASLEDVYFALHGQGRP